MSDPIETQLLSTATAGIKSVTVDGVTTEVLPIADQIKADQYLALRNATRCGNLPIGLTRIIPAGAADDRGRHGRSFLP